MTFTNRLLVYYIIMVITLLISVASAQAILPSGVTQNRLSMVDITDTDITFTSLDNGFSITTSLVVDDFPSVIPMQSILTDKGKLPQGKLIDSGSIEPIVPEDITSEYSLTENKLKEIITLQTDHQLSFPITIPEGYKLVPWYNGQWKIISAINSNTMEGLLLEKPYGVDANGKYIEMFYTYNNNLLSLSYNKTITTYIQNPITHDITEVYSNINYPLVIDPTWVIQTDHYIDTISIPGFTLVMWNSTGNTTWTPLGNTTVSYLVIGGGGAGAQNGGGGGGAGAFRNGTLSVNGTINITVGAGGSFAGYNVPGNNGINSTFSTITSTGGGGGGAYSLSGGQTGGSGGGAGGQTGGGLPLNISFGNAGGSSNGQFGGSGGGGKGSIGVNASGYNAGNGGTGIQNNLTGILTWYSAGGGGGGANITGFGGSGIGGNGTYNALATNGVPNTGSGGGGAYYLAGWGTPGSGGSGIVIISFAVPGVTFTSNKTNGTDPLSIQFNDTSTGYPSSWMWNYSQLGGAQNVTFSTLQNPTNTFITNRTGGSSYANYSISLYAYNRDGGNVSAPNWINVSWLGTPIANFYGNPTSGSPGVLIFFTDLSTKGNTTNLTYNWSFGDDPYTNSPFSSTQGNVSHVYGVAGTYDVKLNITNANGTSVMTKSQYIIVSTSQQTQQVQYIPKQTTFRVVDKNDNPIVSASINAIFNMSTLPTTTTSWLISNYGMNTQAANEAMNGTLLMSGITDGAGYITFTMQSSFGYDVNVVYNSSLYHFMVSGRDNYYILRITDGTYTSPEDSMNMYGNLSNATLTFTEPDPGNLTMGVDYLDNSGLTNNIYFAIKLLNNNTIIYNTSQTITGAQHIIISQTFPNIRGQQWLWWYDAHRTV